MSRKFPNPKKYILKNPKKYIGDKNEVIYRSSWEKRFFLFCESCEEVIEWNSEDVIIPYISVDGKTHNYHMDIYMKTKKGKFLIEIKPESQTTISDVPKRKTKKYLNEVYRYEVNKRKWETANLFAKKHGMTFLIVTEKILKPSYSNRKLMENLVSIGVF